VKGRIAAGPFADFAILSADNMTVPEEPREDTSAEGAHAATATDVPAKSAGTLDSAPQELRPDRSNGQLLFIPKCRRKMLYVELRRHLGEVFRRLAEQKEVGIKEDYPRVNWSRHAFGLAASYRQCPALGSKLISGVAGTRSTPAIHDGPRIGHILMAGQARCYRRRNRDLV
jgi:hypothetical protein